LSTKLTVARETPASRATSVLVARLLVVVLRATAASLARLPAEDPP
jgi:hypothetical protein